MCYCPPETKYGHIPAPEGSPLGTPPVKRGRPIYWCQPSTVGMGMGVYLIPVLGGGGGYGRSLLCCFECRRRV